MGCADEAHPENRKTAFGTRAPWTRVMGVKSELAQTNFFPVSLVVWLVCTRLKMVSGGRFWRSARHIGYTRA